MRRRPFWSAIAVLVISTLACNLPGLSFPFGGLDFDTASQRVIDDVIQPAALDHPVIVFGLQDPIGPDDDLSLPDIEGYEPSQVPTAPDSPSWFFWIEDAPGALFVHPTRFVLVRRSDGALTVQDQEWWPVLNGEPQWTDDQAYWDAANWVYSSGVTRIANRSHSEGHMLAALDVARPPQGTSGGKTVGLVLNGWKPGQSLKDMFETDSKGIHDALKDSGFDVTYLGPKEDTNPDRDGEFDDKVWIPWFLQKAKELKDGDTLFVYLTGHGFVGHKGNGFAGPMGEDTLVTQLKRFEPGVHIIVLVQACHSGAFINGLRTVADVTVVSTSDQDAAYADLDTGQLSKLKKPDVNDADTGSEFVSGFVEDWNADRNDPKAQATAKARAQRSGTNTWEEMAALAYISAVAKDVTAQNGMEFPSLVRGAPGTRPTATPTATATLAPTATPTATATPTDTPTATTTRPATETLAPTPYSTSGTVNVESASCRHGPSQAFLYKYGLHAGNLVMVRGRLGGWLLVQPEDYSYPCWISGNLLNVDGEVSSLPYYDYPPFLPRTDIARQPTGVSAQRTDGSVKISWDDATYIPSPDRRGYLIDARVCRNGVIVQLFFHVDSPTYTIEVDENCSQKSTATIYVVHKDGYGESRTIELPG